MSAKEHEEVVLGMSGGSNEKDTLGFSSTDALSRQSTPASRAIGDAAAFAAKTGVGAVKQVGETTAAVTREAVSTAFDFAAMLVQNLELRTWATLDKKVSLGRDATAENLAAKFGKDRNVSAKDTAAEITEGVMAQLKEAKARTAKRAGGGGGGDDEEEEEGKARYYYTSNSKLGRIYEVILLYVKVTTKKGIYYVIDDVTCTCRGFERMDTCSHADKAVEAFSAGKDVEGE